MEDIIVHPDYQNQGVGIALVNKLLEEAERMGLEIVTVTFAAEHTGFYERAGSFPVLVDFGENSHIPSSV